MKRNWEHFKLHNVKHLIMIIQGLLGSQIPFYININITQPPPDKCKYIKHQAKNFISWVYQNPRAPNFYIASIAQQF